MTCKALSLHIGLAPCHLRFAKIDLTAIRKVSPSAPIFSIQYILFLCVPIRQASRYFS